MFSSPAFQSSYDETVPGGSGLSLLFHSASKDHPDPRLIVPEIPS